jgi:hypothetical protein
MRASQQEAADLHNVGSSVGDLLGRGDVVLALAHPALARAVGPAGQHLTLSRQEQRVRLTRRHLQHTDMITNIKKNRMT